MRFKTKCTEVGFSSFTDIASLSIAHRFRRWVMVIMDNIYGQGYMVLRVGNQIWSTRMTRLILDIWEHPYEI